MTVFTPETLFYIYYPIKLVRVDDGSLKDARRLSILSFVSFGEKDIFLYHYTSTQFADVFKASTYWTTLETLVPEYAGEGTGIGDNECIWRATWRFPIADAYSRLQAGAERWSKVGRAREFHNIEPVPLHEVTWDKMDDCRP